MTEETVFESESTKTTAEVAALLHHLGDSLRDTSTVAFQQDDQTTTIAVPSELSVTVEVEREANDDGGEETEVEIELEWEAEEAEEAEVEETEAEEAGAEEVEGVEAEEPEEVEETEAEEPEEVDSKREDAERPSEFAPIADSLEPDEAPRTSLGRFEVYRDRADEWRWRLVHRNGNIIATSGEGYASRQNAEKGLRSVMTNAPDADVTTPEG